MRFHKVKFLRSIYSFAVRSWAIRNNVEFQPDLKVGIGSFINASTGLTIGKEVSIGATTWISCNGSIGNGVLISSQVGIVSRHEHNAAEVGVPISRASTLGDPHYVVEGDDQIVIGDDVWIGFGAILLSGTNVGRGAIIGAGSLVTSDVPPYAIMAGNPARLRGWRFKDEVERAAHENVLATRWS